MTFPPICSTRKLNLGIWSYLQSGKDPPLSLPFMLEGLTSSSSHLPDPSFKQFGHRPSRSVRYLRKNRFARTGAIWQNFRKAVTTRAAAFYTCWISLITCIGSPYISELQETNFDVTRAWTRSRAASKVRYLRVRLILRR